MKMITSVNRSLLKAQLKIKDLLKREEGPTMTEYALMVAVVALVAVAGAIILGTGLKNLFTNIGNAVDITVPTVP